MADKSSYTGTAAGTSMMPSSRLGRFMKLSALSAGASTRYVGQLVKGVFQDKESRDASLFQAHLTTVREAVEVMDQLKGAVMKVGQLISVTHEGGILPTELSEVFAKLQHQASTLPFPLIQKRIEEELGKPLECVFEWLDETPLAAASIGQVHAARLLSGQPVVVKVQYPGVDESVESDLWHVRTLLKSTGLLGRSGEADLLFDEVRARMLEELNYLEELQNLQQFRAFFAHDARVLLPEPLASHCTRRLLVLSRIDGLTLEEVLSLHPEPAWRNRLGETLFELMLTQLALFQTLHADPQLGNFRFLEDGRIILYDFGCVKRFEAPFLKPYLAMMDAGIRRDERGLAHAFEALGILPPQHKEGLALLLRFCDLVFEPLRRTPYRFEEDAHIFKDVKRMATQFLAWPEIQAHPDLVYLHRTYFGIYFILTRLRAEGDWQGIFYRLYAQAQAQWQVTEEPSS